MLAAERSFLKKKSQKTFLIKSFFSKPNVCAKKLINLQKIKL